MSNANKSIKLRRNTGMKFDNVEIKTSTFLSFLSKSDYLIILEIHLLPFPDNSKHLPSINRA